jgi:diacylglycerol O-acyltransferase / wax synthase
LPLVPRYRQKLHTVPFRLGRPVWVALRTGIAIFSYCGTVTFGITGDFAANPDLEVLARGIESGLSELLAAGQRHQRRAAIKGRPAMTHP